MRFIWRGRCLSGIGEHHVDEVHLGRRAPRGQGSSGEENITWRRAPRGGGSFGEETTTWTRFIWRGEHHVDEVHPGRRAPCRRGSSGEESTTWTRFIWGGEYHADKVHLGRRAPCGRGSFGEEREVSRPSRQLVANFNYQRRMCV